MAAIKFRALGLVLLIVSTTPVTLAEEAQRLPIRYQPIADSPIGEKNPQAPAQLNEYAFLIGDWDADMVYSPHGQKPMHYWAKWHNHWILDGYAVMQEWRGPFYTGIELRYYNPQSKQWTGRNLYIGGDWKQTVSEWQGDKMVVQILDARDQTGHFINRETYFDIEKDRFKMKSDRSYDGGKTWVTGEYHMQVIRSGADS